LSARWMSTACPASLNAATLQPIFGVGMPRSGRYGRSGTKSASIVRAAIASEIWSIRS